jgi:uncharacterized protein
MFAAASFRRALVGGLMALAFSGAASSQVVISQSYGGGGNSGATYTHDFIEIFNRGNAPQNLNGWSVQYASATGSTWQVTDLTNVTLQPGQYYLVQQAQGAGGTTPLPTPDTSGSIAMAGGAAKVALVSSTTALSGTCPVDASIQDFVGMGPTANCFEGAAPTPVPSNTTAVLRADGGCTDTNQNSTDFTAVAPTPRNTASPLNPCTAPDLPPTVSNTLPTDGATDVALDSAITIDFSEDVTLTDPWYALECPVATPIASSYAGADPGSSFTITPDEDLPPGTTCTVTVLATQVSDVDGDPDPMAADFSFSFTTLTPITDPQLSINDVSLAEGDSGTTDFVFTVTLTNAAAEAFTVDFGTQDGTALAGEDYEATSGTLNFAGIDGEQHIITVPVNGDTTPEPDETFTVVLSGLSLASVTLARSEGIGTILNDDGLPFTPIHEIQGAGQLSPLDGQVVTTRGVVTGIRSNSFFIQTPDGQDDGDDETSEGLYIFSTAPGIPPGLAVGDLVYVTGTVVEFVPAADPNQLPITEITNVSQVLIDQTGLPLPAPITLDPLDPDGAIDQLERYEFMRVRIPAFTVTAPTRSGGTDEYFGVIAGNDIPRREPGVDIQNPLPAEAPANVPRWDSNPELIRVKSNLLVGGAAVPMRAGTELEELVGVLDYAFRRYSVLTTAAAAPVIVSTPEGTATSAALPQDVTIGAFNVENYSGTSGTVFERKTNKFSEVIRDFLGYPDILGIVEVASIDTLDLLAQRINTQAVAAGDPDPMYTAHIESTVGTQRLGFLIKRASSGGAPRVQILNIEERDLIIDGQPAGVLCPDGETRTIGLLNDRPPLVLDALVTGANGAEYTVTVINNHLKSLIGVDSEDPAGANYDCFNFDADGTPIATGGEGRRNRAKRQQEAEYLAGVVDEIQQANPGRPVVLVGDFNAFEFNDGLADVMGTLTGVPSPDDETVVPGDGIDFLDPDLIPMAYLVDEEQRYSYVFSGTRQVLDHVVINEAVVDTTVDVRKEFARVNADFTNVDGTSTLVPFRSSDHDPTKAYLTVSAFFTADLRVFDASVDPAQASVGDPVTFALKLENLGGDGSVNPGLLFDLPAGVGFANVAASPGWTCSPPVSGASGQFGCFADSGSLGQFDVVEFSLDVEVLDAAAGTTVVLAADASADSTDPEDGNNSATGQIEVAALADLALAAQARAATVPQGEVAIVDFSAENLGPNPATDVSLALSVSGLNMTEPLPQVLAPAGWTCGEWVVAAGIANSACTAATFPVGSAGFEVSVSTSTLTGSNLSFQGEISATTADPVGGNGQAGASVAIGAVADLRASLSGLPAVAQIGQEIQFTATLENLGPTGGSALAGSELQVDLNVASDAVDYENDGLGILLCSVQSVSASSSRVVCVDSVGLAAQSASSVGIRVVVPAALSLQSLEATASASGPVTDPDSSNNVVAGSIAVNTAPTANDASFLVLIGTPNGFVLGQIEATDADGDELAFSLTAGNGDGAFAIDSAGVLTVASSAAITGGRSLTVTVQDGRGGSASATITITTSDPLEQLDIFSNGFED